MPTITIPDSVQIAYDDSGPVPNSNDYITLVILHGSLFHNLSFKPLLSICHKHNLRVVNWNRREYPGSTPYTDSELAELSDPAKGRNFLDRLGNHVSDWLVSFIKKEKIPPISNGRKSGGVAILGWSMGCATAMPIFADPKFVSTEAYTLLKDYVKDLVFYDPPHLAVGHGDSVPADAKVYDTWTDPDYKDPEERFKGFVYWVTSYCPDQDLNNLSLSIEALDHRKFSKERTFKDKTLEEISEFYTLEAAVRSEFPMYVPPMQPAIKNLSNSVIYDAEKVSSIFPEVPILYIGASRTSWHSSWAYLKVKEEYEQRAKNGDKVRAVHFRVIQGGNHFVHYDRPEDFLNEVAAGITGY